MTFYDYRDQCGDWEYSDLNAKRKETLSKIHTIEKEAATHYASGDNYQGNIGFSKAARLRNTLEEATC